MLLHKWPLFNLSEEALVVNITCGNAKPMAAWAQARDFHSPVVSGQRAASAHLNTREGNERDRWRGRPRGIAI